MRYIYITCQSILLLCSDAFAILILFYPERNFPPRRATSCKLCIQVMIFKDKWWYTDTLIAIYQIMNSSFGFLNRPPPSPVFGLLMSHTNLCLSIHVHPHKQSQVSCLAVSSSPSSIHIFIVFVLIVFRGSAWTTSSKECELVKHSRH